MRTTRSKRSTARRWPSIEGAAGVKSAVAVTALPYSGHSSGASFTIEGRPFERGDQPSCQLQSVSDSFFRTLGVPLRSGRLLDDTDGAETLRAGVIGERMAQKWWPHESPVGKRIKLGAPDSKGPWITIVGVAGDVTHDAFERLPRPVLYVPLTQSPKAMDGYRRPHRWRSSAAWRRR